MPHRHALALVPTSPRPPNASLPVVHYDDPDFDPTTVDFSDFETLTVMQEDSFGNIHTVILSTKILTQCRPLVEAWFEQNLAK